MHPLTSLEHNAAGRTPATIHEMLELAAFASALQGRPVSVRESKESLASEVLYVMSHEGGLEEFIRSRTQIERNALMAALYASAGSEVDEEPTLRYPTKSIETQYSNECRAAEAVATGENQSIGARIQPTKNEHAISIRAMSRAPHIIGNEAGDVISSIPWTGLGQPDTLNRRKVKHSNNAVHTSHPLRSLRWLSDDPRHRGHLPFSRRCPGCYEP